jgi:hypothetical protein
MNSKVVIIMTQGKCSDPKAEARRRAKIAKYSLTRTYTLATRRKISKTKIGQRNPEWKGARVGYRGVHEWVDANVDKNKAGYGVCAICGKYKKLDSHNLSERFTRKASNWLNVCRRCHDNIKH